MTTSARRKALQEAISGSHFKDTESMMGILKTSGMRF